MQLKSLAKTPSISKQLAEALNITDENELRSVFSNIGKKYTRETLKAAIAQSELNAAQIKTIMSANGLQGQLLETTTDELANAASTNMVTKAQKAASSSTLGLGEAFKGLGMKLKSLVTAHPVLTGIAVGITAIAAAYKVWDVLTVTLKEQKEKLEDVKKSYEGVKEELQDISDEIQNTKNAIDELEAKPNLSWVEKEELERLREVTKELELQKQLKEDEQVTAAGKLYKENVKSFNKEFESSYGTSSVSELISRLSSGDIGIGQLDTDDNVTDMIAALQFANEEKAKLTDEETIAEYEAFIDDTLKRLKDKGPEFLSSISGYKQNMLEIASVRDLSESEQAFYDSLSSMQKMIYEFYSPATWNNLEFDSIFDTEGLEKTKDELIELWQNGMLDESSITQFTKLSEAIENSELIVGSAETKISSFIGEIAALASEEEQAADAVRKWTFSETLTNLDHLKSKFDTLNSTFSKLSDTDNPISFDDYHGLHEAFGDLSNIDDYIMRLQNARNNTEETNHIIQELAGSYLAYSKVLDNVQISTASLVEASLKEMGIENSHELVLNALAMTDEEYALQKQFLTEKGYELTNASYDEINAFLNEAVVAEQTKTSLYQLALQKLSINNTKIDTASDIDNIIALANAANASELAMAKLKNAQDVLNHPGSGADWYRSKKAAEETIAAIENGTFDFGFTPLNANDFKSNTSYKPTSGNQNDRSATPSTQTKETFNWIERAIKRVQEALARLTKIRDNTFKTWSERNNALQSEIAATTHELQLQAQAHYKYLELADAIPLDDYHKALVQSGAIDLETVTDSNLKELISEYEDFYQKAVDAYDAVEDLQRTLSQLAKTRFDSVLSQFNNELSLIESRKEQLDNSISDMETRGYAVSTKLYEELALSEAQNLSKIRAEHAALQNTLNNAVADGSILAYSEEWYNMAGTINGVTAAIQKSQTQLTQYQNTLRELNWENFDNLRKTIGRITEESDFLIDLLQNDSLISETGTFTGEGLATAGLHAVNYNIFMAQADSYAKKLREIHKELANDPYNQTLIDKERELQDAQRDSILSAEQEKQAMVSLARNAIQEQINALETLISKKKESFHTEKDLYEFQKTIAEKTKAVTDIKKQLSVAKLDTSEEGKQRLLELQNRLKNAEEDLKDTQYDRWIKEQETLLDNMMAEYEALQNELSENTDLLLKDLISMTNENASAISDTIRTKTDELGITLSEELETIFNGDGSVKNIVSIYSDNFNSHMTTLQDVLNGIEQKNTEMITAIDNLGTSFITAINTAACLFNTDQGTSPTLPENGNVNAFNQTPAAAPSSPTQGQRVDSASGIWYASSAGANPSGNVNHFAPDYFIVDRINPNSPYPYHIQAYINGKAAGGSGWVKASQIGYKDGLKNAKTAHLAWTQEDGGELIYRKSDHALFTPIGAGDAVFTRQMSDNLWNMAKGTYSVPEPYTRSLATSQGGDVIISIDKMNLPDVTNPQQFASRFVDTLKNDSKVQSAIRSVSVDLLAGRPKSQVNTF